MLCKLIFRIFYFLRLDEFDFILNNIYVSIYFVLGIVMSKDNMEINYVYFLFLRNLNLRKEGRFENIIVI